MNSIKIRINNCNPANMPEYDVGNSLRIYFCSCKGIRETDIKPAEGQNQISKTRQRETEGSFGQERVIEAMLLFSPRWLICRSAFNR
jgi:hypothetical protein